jgi:hypothetical protein
LKGDIDQAAYQFNVVLKADPNHLAALLSQVTNKLARRFLKMLFHRLHFTVPKEILKMH